MKEKPVEAISLLTAWRADAILLPGALIAVLSTLHILIFPPPWLHRLPQAIVDIVRGDREQLRNKLTEAVTERDALSGQLTDVRESLQQEQTLQAETDKTVSSLTEERNALKNALQKSSTALETQDRKISELEQAIATRTKELNAQQQKISKLESTLAERQNTNEARQIITLQQDLRAAQNRESATQEHLSELESRLRSAETDRTHLKDEVARLQQRSNLAEQRLKSTVQSLEERTNESSRSQADVIRLQSTLTSVERVRELAQGEAEKLRDELTTQQQEAHGLTRRLAELEQESIANKKELARGENEIIGLRKNLRELESQQLQAQEQRQDLASRLSNALDRTTEQQSRLKELIEERDLLQKKLKTGTEASESKLVESEKLLNSQAEKLSAMTSEAASLNAALETSKAEAAALEMQNGELQSALQTQQTKVAELTDRLSRLDQDLASNQTDLSRQREEIAGLQRELSNTKSQQAAEIERRKSLESQFSKASSRVAENEAKVDDLLRERSLVQGELLRLLTVARAATEKSDRQAEVLKEQDDRFDSYYASQLAELSQFRSDFFGELSSILGDREDIRVVGDRFVFQAEVLFDSGSASLGASGRAQLSRVAGALKQIAPKIPANLKWVLQIDGHTDKVPIHSSQFISNWELSTARAISVVNFLMEQGIPPENLSANGFAEFQPLDPSDTPAAYRNNRRIELKLTTR